MVLMEKAPVVLMDCQGPVLQQKLSHADARGGGPVDLAFAKRAAAFVLDWSHGPKKPRTDLQQPHG